MNELERFILLHFCNSLLRMKWKGGDLSLSFYDINEAMFQLDNFSGYDYAIVDDGFFKGWTIK